MGTKKNKECNFTCPFGTANTIRNGFIESVKFLNHQSQKEGGGGTDRRKPILTSNPTQKMEERYNLCPN